MAQQRLVRSSALEMLFINAPKEWPRWPILPVKKRAGDIHAPDRLGIVHAATPTRVYFANLFTLDSIEPHPKTWDEALSKLVSKDYPDVEALLDEYAID